MANAIGYVTKTDDGGFVGKLGLGLNTRIEIVANEAKDNDNQPDYRVYSDHNGELGGGWTKVGKTSGKEYISLTLAHPMIGPRRIFANLGRAAKGSKDEFAILWNPA